MKKIIFIFLLLIFTISFFNCSKDNSPSGPSFIASEIWSFVFNNDTNLKSFNNFKKKNDGSVVFGGNWFFKYDTAKVVCPFYEAPVTFVNDTTIQFLGNGNAYCSIFPPGQQYSTFNLTVTGIHKNGLGTGNWTITFTNPIWTSPVYGIYTATRTYGSGITP